MGAPLILPHTSRQAKGFRTFSDYFLGFSENNYEILNAVALKWVQIRIVGWQIQWYYAILLQKFSCRLDMM